MAERDPITCHVLDTTTGRPAPNMKVTLTCKHNLSVSFAAITNADGRIANWTDTDGSLEVIDLIKKYCPSNAENAEGIPKGSSVWSLKVDTGGYYGFENTFFPIVELTFLVKEGQHFHVPLLLGPYSYTTYRGS